MNSKISRRKFLEKAVVAGGALALSSIGVAHENAKSTTGKRKRANELRPLLFSAGMIYSKWLDGSQPSNYDLRQMEALRDIGGKHTSVSLDWCDLEKEKGKWDWSFTDKIVGYAQQCGLAQGAYVGNTPKWALPERVPAKNGYRFPPRDDCEKDFRNYCRKVAEHYKGVMEEFGFWNEPNGCSWINDNCANGDMFESYTRWLKIAYESLKEGNPNCRVIAGALDYRSDLHEAYRYLEGMYGSGAWGYFDSISIHPYGKPLHWDALRDTHSTMNTYRDGDKGVYIGEYGYYDSKGEDAARSLREVLNKLLTPDYSYVKLANYLCITDLPGTENYGLFDRKLNPRPIAHAFKEIATREI